MPSSTESSTHRRWHGAYAALILGLLALGLFGVGSYLAARIGEAVNEQAEVRGTWLFDHDRDNRIVMTAHGETHMRSATYGLEFAVYTDSRGLRVAAPGAETAAPVDLLLVGESFFFGWGVDHADTLGAVLEAHTGLRVANSAVPAAGTLGALRGVERNADLKPRWVAYGVIDAHLNRNVCPCVLGAMTPLCMSQEYVAFDADMQPYTHAPLESVWAPRDGTRRAFESIVRDREPLSGPYWALRMALGGLYRQRFIPCEPDLEKQLPAMNYALTQLLEAARKIGAEPIVMYIPNLDVYMAGAGDASLRATLEARESELTLLDLGPDVVEHYRAEAVTGRPAENLRFELDYHPSPAGHRLMARRLCRHLETRIEASARPSGWTCDWPLGAGPARTGLP